MYRRTEDNLSESHPENSGLTPEERKWRLAQITWLMQNPDATSERPLDPSDINTLVTKATQDFWKPDEHSGGETAE